MSDSAGAFAMISLRRRPILAVLALLFAGATQAAVHDANEGLSVDRSRGAESGANYRLEDEGGDGRGVVGLKKSFEVIGAG